MDPICKLLGVVDLTAAAMIIIFVPANLSILKYILVIPLAIKGAFSLLG